MFTPDLMFTKYEADLLCQKITNITTKGRGVRVSHSELCCASNTQVFSTHPLIFVLFCAKLSKLANKRQQVGKFLFKSIITLDGVG